MNERLMAKWKVNGHSTVVWHWSGDPMVPRSNPLLVKKFLLLSLLIWKGGFEILPNNTWDLLKKAYGTSKKLRFQFRGQLNNPLSEPTYLYTNLNCGSTLNIYQNILKNGNLPHIRSLLILNRAALYCRRIFKKSSSLLMDNICIKWKLKTFEKKKSNCLWFLSDCPHPILFRLKLFCNLESIKSCDTTFLIMRLTKGFAKFLTLPQRSHLKK